MSQKAYSKHNSALSEIYGVRRMCPIIGLIYTDIKFSPIIKMITSKYEAIYFCQTWKKSENYWLTNDVLFFLSNIFSLISMAFKTI